QFSLRAALSVNVKRTQFDGAPSQLSNIRPEHPDKSPPRGGKSDLIRGAAFGSNRDGLAKPPALPATAEPAADVSSLGLDPPRQFLQIHRMVPIAAEKRGSPPSALIFASSLLIAGTAAAALGYSLVASSDIEAAASKVKSVLGWMGISEPNQVSQYRDQ